MKKDHKSQKDRRIFILLAIFLFYTLTLWGSVHKGTSNFVFWDNTNSYDFNKLVDAAKNSHYNEVIEKNESTLDTMNSTIEIK